MDAPRTFTPEEAQALLPQVRPLLAQLRDAFHGFRFAREQWTELREVYGEDPASVEQHPAHDEAVRWRREAEAQGQRVQALVDELDALGVEVKDPMLGLIDFYAQREGELVYLCFRDDEDALRYWHPLSTGFAGRRPLSEF
ncbi:MAG: hypothetical protein QOE90_1179 [Thermoplasmata archaeon]|nr:hypothetical protein [Thermoplasmata archaeon]